MAKTVKKYNSIVSSVDSQQDVADLKTAVGSLTTKIMRQEYEREVNGKDSDDE